MEDPFLFIAESPDSDASSTECLLPLPNGSTPDDPFPPTASRPFALEVTNGVSENPSELTTFQPALEDALDDDELDEYLLSPSEVRLTPCSI